MGAAEDLDERPVPWREWRERQQRPEPERERLVDPDVPYELDARAQAVVSAHPAGLTQVQVAELLGCSYQAVQAVEARAIERARRVAEGRGLGWPIPQ